MKNLYVKWHNVSLVNENSDPTDINLNKYVDHPSIFKIKEYFNKYTDSNFLEITPNNIKKQLKNLAPKKTPKCLNKGQDMSIVMRYIGQIKCTKKDFPKEPHLFV